MIWIVKLASICFLAATSLWSSEPGANTAPQDAIRTAMAAAAERQRAAVQSAMGNSLEVQRRAIRAQAQAAVETSVATESFFTVPWPKPATMLLPPAAECDPLPAGDIDSLISENAKREGLDPALLREVMRRESGFRPCAISRAGAQGLMQLMPATAEEYGVTDPFDPRQNAAAGARFLRRLMERYGGDLSLALGAYNAGPGRVDEAGGVPDIPETRHYVGAILRTLVLQ